MMKAAVLTECGSPLEIQQVPIPQPGPKDILVKLIVCGVCHSDLHGARGEWRNPIPLPLILGHEGIGEIVECGTDVSLEKHAIKRGDLIGVQFLQGTCRQCEFCRTGQETLCSTRVGAGLTKDGAFAEYALINVDFAVKLPDGMDPFASAPLYCAGVTMYKALKVSGANPGQWISIVGVGGLGSLGIKYAKAMGFRVIGVVAENDKAAADLGRTMGADEVYDGPLEQHSEFIKQKTDGGVQAALVCVPIIPVYAQALQSLRQGGRLVMIAIPSGSLAVPVDLCIVKQLEIVGSFIGTRADLEEALDMAQKHGIICPVQRCALEDINEVFDSMEKYRLTGRTVIDFTRKNEAVTLVEGQSK